MVDYVEGFRRVEIGDVYRNFGVDAVENGF